MAKVILCTPHGGQVPPDFHRAIVTMQHQSLQHTFVFGEIDMMTVGKARNELVRQAIANDQDVAWFIDDDVIVPPNAGILIDQALSLGVVSGLYFSRRAPYTPQLYNLAKEPQYQTHGTPLYWALTEYSKGLQVVDACGGGCVAIKVSVLRDLEAHMHAIDKRMDVYREELTQLLLDKCGEDAFNQVQKLEYVSRNLRIPMAPWFEFLDLKGEDLYFCERVRDMGAQIWANTDVKCDHLATVPINEAHFQYLKDNNLLRRVEQ